MKKLTLSLCTLLAVLSCKQNTTNPDALKHEKPASKDYAAHLDSGSGIINNTNSPHVKLKSIDIGDCRWTEGFWAEKWKVAEETMIPHMGEILKGDIGHGYNNFKIAAGLKEGEHKGFWWHDGDFYKWMEAKMYLYGVNKDEKIVEEIDEIISVIAQAQQDDGYLSTPAIIRDDIEPFTNRKYHELYNSGHLLTSACIHYRLTGKTNFLDIAVKHADYLYKLFSPKPDHLKRFGFNQTQIMGLVELYRTTKDKRYLELAEQFINMRGTYKIEDDETTVGYPIGDMVQERVPLREETEAVGHAVLALYYYAGAADVYAETGEKALIDALERLWDNVTNKKMYITGAIGQTHYGRSSRLDKIEEGFIDEYMMPNMTAYNETCANICNSMFNYRMLTLTGDAKHGDIMELVLHNSGLSGISLDGKNYYYSNPLRKIDGALDYEKMNVEFPERQPYLKCFCCPPNLVRTIAKSPGWAYSKSENGIAVNLYGGNELKTTLLDGSPLKLTQKTDYPWDGAVKITVDECKAEAFEVLLRIPSWAKGTQIKVNGIKVAKAQPGTFAKIERQWAEGDEITIDMPMETKFIEGHPRIEEVRNQVALKRGPVVYCIESADLPEKTDITNVYLSSKKQLTPTFRPDFLGGITTLEGNVLIRKDKIGQMYQEVSAPEFESFKTNFIPYYAWSNRGQGEMTVFLPVIWD
ncbi:glycoside hydrolase family 127 protein [Zobellia galactanivorans]|uniref:glycoside hydrolase family 127 protein n=1 Tax=Zobellia galactanivorans (strain DSM 12802 / CCUG 47099 / CIP 106680 / NCIMB 13871 / Dsij) TaxID=63186 RepID=UPI0026E43C93|nr:beta-L-arabinofuranosidase domain-containing protein [Zobellia galactanivorans]MDO6810730.1 glycoside hydrolase family 127 protein [Zobellia galactanivorans]